MRSKMSGRRPGQKHQVRRKDREDKDDVVNPQDTTARTSVTKYAAYRESQVGEATKIMAKVVAPGVGEGNR